MVVSLTVVPYCFANQPRHWKCWIWTLYHVHALMYDYRNGQIGAAQFRLLSVLHRGRLQSFLSDRNRIL